MSSDTQLFRQIPQGSSDFQVTDWLVVTDRTKVVQRYLYPLNVYLIGLLSRFPDYRNEAEDLLQDFVTHKILQPGWLEKADPKKGRFRDLLKNSLRNFILGEIRKREAEKRGGKNSAVSLDDLEQEIGAPEPLSDSFDLTWLQMLLTETLEQMQASCIASDNMHVWKIFETRIVRPNLEGANPPPYDELVLKCGLKSPAQATNALATGKRMFARHLRGVIAQYETGDRAVRAELDDFRVLLEKRLPALYRNGSNREHECKSNEIS
jgi:hypothetical protein